MAGLLGVEMVKFLRPVVVIIRKRFSSLLAARVGSSVLPSIRARVISFGGDSFWPSEGLGSFPFIKPSLIYLRVLVHPSKKGEDKVQAAVMPPAPGYFLLRCGL